MKSTPRIGTRGSDLALWQANFVANSLGGDPEIIVIKTAGDRIQHLSLDKVEGKGFFIKEIEAALLSKEVDVAVHSFKDLPTEETPGLQICVVPARAPVRDVVVHRHTDPTQRWGLAPRARVGTSSIRRKAQLSSLRPDLEMVDLRGNVPTRYGKVRDGELDAVILAEAGLTRLGFDEHARNDGLTLTAIGCDEVCPAPAQGALAIQTRSDDEHAQNWAAALHDSNTAGAVGIERALLSHFGGGCHLPLGAYCERIGESWRLSAIVAAPDGSERIEASHESNDSAAIVREVHSQLVSRGAEKYL